MDADRFAAALRTLTTAPSRRTVLRALGGLGLAGLLRWDDVAAKKRKKKPCPPCKTRKKGKCKGLLPDGTACAGGTCQGGTCVCVPESQVATCAGRCGTWPNTCGQYVSCPSCTDGKLCLGNGSCGIPCGGSVGSCPASCICGFGTPEGQRYCIQSLPGCPVQPACGSTLQCPLGSLCHDAPPPPTNCGRTCWSVCGA